jgi:DNA-binding response OmpR family regulator
MAEQNRDNADAPVLCFHEELMHAVWDDEPLHSQSDLNRLVWGIRKKLEAHVPDDLLENERGVGYRLRTCADG